MIPKFRAYDKINSITRYVDMIDFDTENISDGGNIFDFDEVVLMQSTGLKDKNGVEIFDGDIVKVLDSVQVNEIDNGGAFVDAHFDELDEVDYIAFSEGGFKLSRTGFDVSICEDVEEFRVIGNIYDNPELLEGE
ncbi:MAG: YopX family protein [Streptococcaceae bacterium]|jgi:uncharacterized phage protein (TIGR01671 family)|nr:YopX family protein [Streptococcaceae bacterium]